jgi:HPt (histidine-containing phosphotransfer) domain-containing protein
MDDYLTKPFQLGALRAVLERWLSADARAGETPEGNPDPVCPTTASQASPDTPLDPGVFETIRDLERQGAQGLLQKAIQLYLEDSPKLLKALEEAVSTADASALGRAAHSLKSMSANLGAVRLAELCKDLEKTGRAGSTGGASRLLAETQAEFDRVRVALTNESVG